MARRGISTAAKLLLLHRRGGGAAWSPANISGLALWLDANDSATLFQDSAASVPVTTNGDLVRRWNNRLGGNIYALAWTDSNRPTYVTDAQNGKPVTRWTASEADRMPFFNNRSTLQNKPYAYVFSAYNPDQITATQRYLIHQQGATSQHRLSITEGSQRFRLYSRRLDADTTVTLTSDTNHGGVACVITAICAWNDGTLALRQNGVQVASGVYASSGNTSDTQGSDGGSLGAFASLNTSDGDICELMIATPSSALSAAEIAQVESYLASKWGITLNP